MFRRPEVIYLFPGKQKQPQKAANAFQESTNPFSGLQENNSKMSGIIMQQSTHFQ